MWFLSRVDDTVERMFATTEPATYADIDAAEHELVRLEGIIARARRRQIEVLAWLDEVKVARVHGSRSMEEWTAAHLDVAPATARDLVVAARASSDGLPGVRDAGEVSFDRTRATLELAAAGASEADLAESRRRDLKGVRRLAAELRRITRVEERELMLRRHLVIEPTLGETAWRIVALAPGYDGHLIAKALQQRADHLPTPVDKEGRGQRMLDALTALAQDYLDGTPPRADAGGVVSGSAVTVFVDAESAGATLGERGGTIAAGPRVGPDTIDRIVCEGVTGIVELFDGRPVRTTDRTRSIPPAIRDAVVHRDGGCVVDGCRSRYRLQPHHIKPRADDGGHDPDNLATLCWYHHHIAIHGYGKRLDPESPPHRRRFLTPCGLDPPA